jgi:hypothetical protein
MVILTYLLVEPLTTPITTPNGTLGGPDVVTRNEGTKFSTTFSSLWDEFTINHLTRTH